MLMEEEQVRILPTKEELDSSKRLEPYTYYDNLIYKLKEDAPESAKKDWELHLSFVEEYKRKKLEEYML